MAGTRDYDEAAEKAKDREHAQKLAIFSLTASILSALIAAGAALAVAALGSQTKSSPEQNNFFAGLQSLTRVIVKQDWNAAQAPNDAKSARVAASNPAGNGTATTAAPQPTSVAPVETIRPATCSGLDRKTWAVSVADVSRIRAENVEPGYAVDVRLTDLTSNAIDAQLTNAEMHNKAGDQFGWMTRDTTVTRVAANSDYLLHIQFGGKTSTETPVSFTATMHFVGNEPTRFDIQERFGCTDLAL